MGGSTYDVSVVMSNQFDPEDGEPGPISVEDVCVAVTDSVYGLERLNEDLLYHPDIPWMDLPGFVVEHGDTHEIAVGAADEDQNLLFCCRIPAPDTLATLALQIWQMPVAESVSPLPNVSWGRIKSMFH